MRKKAGQASGMKQFSYGGKKLKPLTIQQCREMMECEHWTDEEVQEFLNSLRTWIDQFYDTHLPKST